MNSKIGMLDGHTDLHGLSLFGNMERIDFSQTPSTTAMPPPSMGQTNLEGLGPLQGGIKYSGMPQQMGAGGQMGQGQDGEASQQRGTSPQMYLQAEQQTMGQNVRGGQGEGEPSSKRRKDSNGGSNT